MSKRNKVKRDAELAKGTEDIRKAEREQQEKPSQGSLAIFQRGAQLLAEADTIQKAKELKDLALTASEWARRKEMGEEAIRYCRSYALEAERKLGQFLKNTPRAKGVKTLGGGEGAGSRVGRQPADELTLSELGLSRDESSEAQALAEVPEDDFKLVKSGEKSKASAIQEVKRRKPKPKPKRKRDLLRRELPPDLKPEENAKLDGFEKALSKMNEVIEKSGVVPILFMLDTAEKRRWLDVMLLPLVKVYQSLNRRTPKRKPN